MAKIFPFRPYRYSTQAGPPDSLVTQPYDKIPPELQERYYAASPHNVVRLIKGKEQPGDNESNNVYTRAAADLDRWIAGGILEQDPDPAFYPYFQEFPHPETGKVYVRQGFIGLAQLEDYSANVVHRHELTHTGPKLDRLELTRQTQACFGQLFMLYDDPGHVIDARLDEASRSEPLLTVEEESGIRHTIWKIDEPSLVAEIQAAMQSKKLLIADGHHRYETALAYRSENPALPGADKTMMTFVNMRASGLVVLATHRVLGGLPGFDPGSFLKRAGEYFTVEQTESDQELQQRLDSVPHEQAVIGAVFAGDPKGYLFSAGTGPLDHLLENLSPSERKLDVVLLHRALIGQALGVSEEDVRELRHIRYVRGFRAAADEVRSGKAQAAFLLRPVPVEQVAEVAFQGGVMPQKSTDFYPKLLAGLTIYRFG